MMDKQKSCERELPPPCLGCKSLHKQYETTLCLARQVAYYKNKLLRAVPLLGHLVSAWECDLQKEREL